MWLPTYMKQVLHFNMSNSQYFEFLPYIAIFLTQIIGGKLADFLIEKKVKVVIVRKVLATVASVLPGLCLALLCLNPPVYACIILMVSDIIILY